MAKNSSETRKNSGTGNSAGGNKQIQNLELYLRAAVDSLPDGFVMWDKNDHMIACNESFKTFFPGIEIAPGFPPHKYLLDFANTGIVPAAVGNEEAWVDEQLKTREEDLDKKITFKAHDGRWILRHDYLTKDGLRIGVRRDVTEQIEREERLKDAEAKAQAADRAKSEFLANMSHEIRTPMNGVMGMAELLAKTEMDAKQAMYTDVIVKSGGALLTIINDILDFSKIDAGQMELDPAPFRLTEAVEDVATLVSSRVAEKDLELIVRVDPKLPDYLVGDVGRIRQIITNIMGNAVKFTESGHVFVNVKGSVEGKRGNETAALHVSIEDTGIGIAETDIETVFDKFSQVDSTAARRHEGTGLGLSITSSLVELMGGKIGVKSDVGSGSTFWFDITLPVHPEQQRKIRPPIDVSGATILVVDDNEVNRSILLEQMASWKFDSAAAHSGQEALAILRAAAENNLRIDCVIMDYHMPGMNGGQAVEAMKADPLLQSVPIIMLTSVDHTEDGKAFSSLGIQGHLTKPTRSSHLLESIIEVLQDRKAEPHKCDNTKSEDSDARKSRGGAVETTGKKRTALPRNTGDRSGFEILICEDNEVNQIVFTQVLQEAGYDFRIAENGKEGVDLFQKHSPGLVVMDVSMPHMNGYQATNAIRQMERDTGGHVPIIGVTAHAIKGDREKCIEAGMDDYLSKPISPDKLIAMIEKWLEPQTKKSRRIA
ncbi:MAG: response regulator [Pseudomonadota bacterium]